MFIIDNKPKKKFVKVTQNDPTWIQTDGFAMYTRAGLEISPDCPTSHSWIIQHAINVGWLKQVAYVDEKSLMWETLKK